MTSAPGVIDFHCHFRPPWWQPQPGQSRRPPEQLKDLDSLAEQSRTAGLALRLLSAPVEGLFGAEGPVPAAEITRLNDYLASAVPARSDVLAGLATVDAFGGTAAAEAQRSVRDLNLAGVVVDSARSQVFFGARVTLPLLEAADDLGFPIFVHPVAAPHRDDYVATAGNLGNSLARGLMNGAAFLTVLQARVLERWPRARLVFAGLGTTALLIAAAEIGEAALRQRLDATAGQIYFDIMGLSAANIRYLSEIIGAERLVVGNDWPFMPPITAQAVADALTAAGLDEAEQALVTGENAMRLLSRDPSQAAAGETGGGLGSEPRAGLNRPTG